MAEYGKDIVCASVSSIIYTSINAIASINPKYIDVQDDGNVMTIEIKENDEIVLKLIGAIIILIGVVFIYDARIITKKLFGFGDQNEVTLGFKIFGFIFTIAGFLIVFFNI